MLPLAEMWASGARVVLEDTHATDLACSTAFAGVIGAVGTSLG